MKRKIVLQEKTISYDLRRSARARRVRITVHPGGGVAVTVPFSAREESAKRFISAHARWLFAKIDFLKKFPPERNIRGAERRGYRAHRENARALVCEKTARFAAILGCGYGKIAIRNQKTRWGSCSKKGNLNFNYKILFLPERLQDYLIVHELAHLGEFSHSPKFWELVGTVLPDYKELRKKLRKEGIQRREKLKWQD